MVLRKTTLIALLACGLAVPAAAQQAQTSLSLGYQWITLSGSNDTYRSQVDEDDGLLLDQLRLQLGEGDKLYDTLRLTASGFGGSPSGNLLLNAAKRGSYRLNFAYRRWRLVSSLLDFANPLQGQQVFPGQHRRDGVLDTFDLNLELFPGKVLTPIFAYRYARERANATTTLHLGQDEFLLAGNTFTRSHDFQAGLGVHLGSLEATVVQGWRNQDGEVGFSLFPGAGSGNNRRPVLDRDVYLNSYSRKTTLSTDAPYTTALLSYKPLGFLRVSGRYVWQDPDADSRLTEQAAGSLVSFKIQRFFAGFSQAALSKASAPNWHGEGRLEVDLPAGFTLAAEYNQRHRELSGWSLVQDVYLAAVNFSGAQGGDVTQLLTARTAAKRDEKETLGTLTSPAFGPVSFWASFSTTDQEYTISPDAREIVVPGNQGGYFQRQVDRWSGGMAFKAGVFALNLDYRKDDADRVVVRTDVTNLERWRGRASLTLGILQVAFSGEKLDANNQVPSNNFDVSSKDWAAELRVNALDGLNFWGSYGKFQTDSAILLRRPETFDLEPSLYQDHGKLLEGGLSFQHGQVFGEAGYAKLENTGNRPYDFSRLYARLDVPLQEGFGLGFEAARYKYQQQDLSLANYTAKRYVFLLRYQK
jgi:hypothetical protein